MVRKRILFAQNFLKSRSLVERIITRSSISQSDIVYEIGPGDGVITSELAKKAKKVIAIEIDIDLINKLKDMFTKNPNVEIINADFMEYQINTPKYKVFSNIPFNITADIARKLLYSSNPPIDTYLILQKEAAMKFSGQPVETEFSVLIKPWFSFEIIWEFERSDFIPVPAVDVVLLHIKKRTPSLVAADDANIYRKFVKFGFEAWKKDLKIAYKNIFTYEQWKRLARENGFPINVTPSQLYFDQWLRIFQFFLRGIPNEKKTLIK